MKSFKVFSMLILFVIVLALPNGGVSAERGLPGSGTIGYGLQISPDGQNANLAIQMSANLGVDWLLLELDWAKNAPDASNSCLTNTEHQFLNQSLNNQYGVIISLTHPPSWAMTQDGPSVDAVNGILREITQKYPEINFAFELFPAPNFQAGWGAPPSPAAYAGLFSKVQEANPGQLLIVGGLMPVKNTLLPGQYSDLDFLQGLYQYGLKDKMPIIGTLANQLSGQPLDAPGANNFSILRRYEEIRQVMLRNQHDAGLIWITRLTAPYGLNLDEQNAWLNSAYPQIRSQLYIGAVIYQSANSRENSSMNPLAGSLILDNNSYHPFYASLRELIAFNAPDDILLKRGRSKGLDLAKNR